MCRSYIYLHKLEDEQSSNKIITWTTEKKVKSRILILLGTQADQEMALGSVVMRSAKK